MIHSLLASHKIKRWFSTTYPQIMPVYRLSYNLLAILLIIPIMVLTLIWKGELLWEYHGITQWFANLLIVAAIIGFWFSLKDYDTADFLGTRQWQQKSGEVEDQSQFSIGNFHRFVRHPWYSLGLVLVWAQEMDPIFLTDACMITLYFIIGSRLEENKLIALFGESYRLYTTKVPGLIPRPWRYISKEVAVQMQSGKSYP